MPASIRSVGNALRMAEIVLIRTARRNAWVAVCENRRFAADRDQLSAPPASAKSARRG